MIRVEFTLFDGSIVDFSIKGHADLAEEGKDILCAAVSIYSINTINSLTEIVGVEDALDIKADKGDLYLKIRYELMTDPQKEQAPLDSDHGQRSQSSDLSEPSPESCRYGSEPGLGGGYDLYRHPQWFCLSCGHPGSLRTQGHRLCHLPQH